MRNALIMAGGSGVRLWPMSRAARPKQLIPFIHGRSLLQIAMDRLDGLLPPEQIYICAGETHRDAIFRTTANTDPQRYYGEPVGRDTLNAVGLVAAERLVHDPDANIAVFTSDHVIEPVDRFQQIVETGFRVTEAHPEALVTFGIEPTHAATGYGYLELGEPIDDGGAYRVDQFREKPDAPTAAKYLAAGPGRYLWNSGMFVWRAKTLMDCIRRFAPTNADRLDHLAGVYQTDRRDAEMRRVYPELDKISVDYAVMEPASRDPDFKVVAIPMPLTWLDVGSWPSFAKTCEQDEHGNAKAAPRALMVDCADTLIASDVDDHLIAAVGCRDLVIVHTADATLICPADQAEKIKQLHEQVEEGLR
ncbi:MAG: mannose-1-phosphate guanyltransferase [Phycisphaeraceae bacterium]|nr:mannose-1-phosphate guanyltransferase [Phycisphaeraceae bacterium]